MNFIKVTNTVIASPKAKRNIRIALMTDIHYCKRMKLQKLNSIVSLLEKNRPTAICIVGDTIDSVDEICDSRTSGDVIEFLYSMKHMGPIFISLADHDRRIIDEKKTFSGDARRFWEDVSIVPNVHVLDNRAYRHSDMLFVGYTMPKEYYHGDVPIDFLSEERKDEDVRVQIDDMFKHSSLFDVSDDKLNLLLMHSPLNINNVVVDEVVSDFDGVLSGHMHNGLVPPVLDGIWRSDKGLISPQRTLMPNNSRGVITSGYGTIYVISGGITKIAESGRKLVLKPASYVFPMQMDFVDFVPGEEKNKVLSRKSKYYMM